MFVIDCFQKTLSSHVRRVIRGSITEENGFLVFDSKLGPSATIEYETEYSFNLISISAIQGEISVRLNNQEGTKIQDTIVFENKNRQFRFVFENKESRPLKYYFRGEIIGFFNKTITAVYNLRNCLIDEFILYDLNFEKLFVKKFEDKKNFVCSKSLVFLCREPKDDQHNHETGKQKVKDSNYIIPVFIDKWFRFLYPTEVAHIDINDFSLYIYNTSKLRLENIIYFCLISTSNTLVSVESIFCMSLDTDVIINVKLKNISLDIRRDTFYQLGKILGIDNEIKKINYNDTNMENQRVKLISKTIENMEIQGRKVKIFPPYGLLKYVIKNPIVNLSIDMVLRSKNKISMTFFADDVQYPFPNEKPIQKVQKYFEIRLSVPKVTKAILEVFKIKYMV